MDLKELRAKHPELAAALIAEGAAAERERIVAVEAQSMAGHEDLIKTLKFDGKTTGPEAAVMVVAAEKQKGARRLEELRAEAPKPAPAAPSADGEHAAAEAAEAALPIEERAKKVFERDEKVRTEFVTVERYTGWLKHEASRKAA